MKASEILQRASSLVGGERERQHGSKVANHSNIAELWNAYLGNRIATRLEARDVALMMVLLKVARTKTGSHNPDDYLDMAGYAGVAGEIAEAEQPVGVCVPLSPGVVIREPVSRPDMREPASNHLTMERERVTPMPPPFTKR